MRLFAEDTEFLKRLAERPCRLIQFDADPQAFAAHLLNVWAAQGTQLLQKVAAEFRRPRDQVPLPPALGVQPSPPRRPRGSRQMCCRDRRDGTRPALPSTPAPPTRDRTRPTAPFRRSPRPDGCPRVSTHALLRLWCLDEAGQVGCTHSGRPAPERSFEELTAIRKVCHKCAFHCDDAAAERGCRTQNILAKRVLKRLCTSSCLSSRGGAPWRQAY